MLLWRDLQCAPSSLDCRGGTPHSWFHLFSLSRQLTATFVSKTTRKSRSTGRVLNVRWHPPLKNSGSVILAFGTSALLLLGTANPSSVKGTVILMTVSPAYCGEAQISVCTFYEIVGFTLESAEISRVLGPLSNDSSTGVRKFSRLSSACFFRCPVNICARYLLGLLILPLTAVRTPHSAYLHQSPKQVFWTQYHFRVGGIYASAYARLCFPKVRN